MHAGCTSGSLAGTFAFTTSGTLILPALGPVPVAAAGSITFDVNGDASGSQDRSLGGEFAHETIVGNISVTRDCVLNFVANVYDTAGNLARTSVITGVLADHNKRIRAIFQSIVLPSGASLPSVLTVDGDRL
jgi:hypothetical protein